jgi:hypothetical protein
MLGILIRAGKGASGVSHNFKDNANDESYGFYMTVDSHDSVRTLPGTGLKLSLQGHEHTEQRRKAAWSQNVIAHGGSGSKTNGGECTSSRRKRT